MASVLYFAARLALVLPMVLLSIAFPLLPAVIALAVSAWGFARKEFIAVPVAFAWAAYSVYEHLMQARILCSGECNIRVDLLLIAPMLALITKIPGRSGKSKP